MTELLILAALLLYGARYAASGIDNGLYYARGRGLSRFDVGLPDIHDGEMAQDIASHLSHLFLIVAIAWTGAINVWQLVLLLFMMWVTSHLFSPLFHKYIVAGSGKDPDTFDWPFTDWTFKKYFANRRKLEFWIFLPTFIVTAIVFILI